MSLRTSFSLFSSLTLLSRIFGFVRDSIMARVLGVGVLSDLFFVAFKLPNLFRSIFAEGALNSAFTPIYSKKLKTDPEGAVIFSRRIIFIVSFFFATTAIICELIMPVIIIIVAPGLEGGSKNFDMAVTLSRIMFPFLPLIGLTSVLASIAQSHSKTFASAIYPIILNIVLIAAPFYFGFANQAINLSYAVLLSGILQLSFLMLYLRLNSISIISKSSINGTDYPDISVLSKSQTLTKTTEAPDTLTASGSKVSTTITEDPDINEFFKKLGPSVLTALVTRAGIVIDTIIASFSEKAISFIYYAERLYQMPLALIGVSLSFVSLPKLSQVVATGNEAEIQALQTKIFRMAFMLVLPAATGLFLMSFEICSLLFGQNLGLAVLRNVSGFLEILTFVLPANVLSIIMNSMFFARSNTAYTTRCAIYSLTLNIASNFAIFSLLEYWRVNNATSTPPFYSVALATAIAGWFNTVLLVVGARKNNFFKASQELRQDVKYFVASTFVMGLILELVNCCRDHFFIKLSPMWFLIVIIQLVLAVPFYFYVINFISYKKSSLINRFFSE